MCQIVSSLNFMAKFHVYTIKQSGSLVVSKHALKSTNHYDSQPTAMRTVMYACNHDDKNTLNIKRHVCVLN